MVVVLARSPRAAAASRGGSARPAWLGVAFILMRGLFWGGGGCPDTELRLLADKVMGGAVRGSTSVRAFTSSTTSTSPCFSSSPPSSHLLQLLLVGSICALACACGFGLWDTPRGAGFQARGGLAVFTRRGRGALLHDQYTFTNDSFSTSIELRLAISYPGMLSDAPCRRCGCGKMSDVNGYHVLTCMPSAVRERIYWHDRIRDEVASFCGAMGLQGVKKEQLVDDASQSRNDVQVEVWNSHGGPLWLDVVTTMPMQASTLASATTIPGVAAR